MLGRILPSVNRLMTNPVRKAVCKNLSLSQRRLLTSSKRQMSASLKLAAGTLVVVSVAGGSIWLNSSKKGESVRAIIEEWTSKRADEAKETVDLLLTHARNLKLQGKLSVFSASESLYNSGAVGIYDKIISAYNAAKTRVLEALTAKPDEKYRQISLHEFRADHNGRVWVAWNGGVYDMTDFMAAHPGGAGRIAMVEGQDLSKFWDVYKLHHRQHIAALMTRFRIGTLSPEDYATVKNETHFDNPYVNDPVRALHPRARIASTCPWNAEPPVDELQKNFITPNDLFFVRNHNPVPDTDIDSWTLTIEPCPALGISQASRFTFQDLLHKLPRHEVLSTLQCAGNRQRDLIETDRPLYVAPSWENGAIGTARWAGVRVSDLLRACGADVDALALGSKSTGDARIVNFIAEDVDETGTQYASVLPIEKVLDPWGDVIMAYEMNGAPLPRDHGFPLRLIAPGTAGCRNAKWVCAIAVTAQPSELDSGSTLDRHFSPSVSFEDHRRHCAECGEDEDRPCATPAAARHDGRLATEFRAGPVIQSMPVTSMVTSPAAGATVEAAPGNAAVAVRGLAWGGAGRGVVRVEVSTDGGETFRAADIVPPPEPPTANGHPAPPAEMGCGRHWTWRQFEDLAPLGAADRARLAAGRSAAVRVCSKAVDGDFNSQPERMRSTWNALGICANHYSCVDVTVRPAPAPPAASDPRPPRAQ